MVLGKSVLIIYPTFTKAFLIDIEHGYPTTSCDNVEPVGNTHQQQRKLRVSFQYQTSSMDTQD